MCLTGDPLFFSSLLCLCLILCVLLVILSFSPHSSVSVWSYVSYWWSSLFLLTPLSLSDLMCLTGDPLFFSSLLCLCLILCVLLMILSFSPHSSISVWSYVSYWWSSLFHLTPLSLSDLMCLTGDPLFFSSLLCLCLILCVLLVILSFSPHSSVSVWSYVSYWWSSLFLLTPLSLSDLMCLTGDPLFFSSLLCLCLILCVLLVILSFSPHSSISVWSYVSYWWSSLFHLTPLSLSDLMCLTGDPLFFSSLLCLCLILCVLLVILSFSPHSSVSVWSYVSYWWSSLFLLTPLSLSDLMCLTGDPLFFSSLLCLWSYHVSYWWSSLCVLLVILSFSPHSSVSVWSYHVSYWWSSLCVLLVILSFSPHSSVSSLFYHVSYWWFSLFFKSFFFYPTPQSLSYFIMCLVCLILPYALQVILSFSPDSSVSVLSYRVPCRWSSLFHLTHLCLSYLTVCLAGDPLFFTWLICVCLILPCALQVILSFSPDSSVSVLSYRVPCRWSSLFHLTHLCLSYLTVCLAGDPLFFTSLHHLCFVLPCALRVIFSFSTHSTISVLFYLVPCGWSSLFHLTSLSAGLDFILLHIVMFQYLALLLNRNIVYFGIHSTPVLPQ